MSHPREQRLRLFRRGNDRCPICLTRFSEDAIESGKVTLEHVPPRSFGLGGIGMCLTCSRCNHTGSRPEQVVAAGLKGREKVRLDVPGLPPLAAYVSPASKKGVWELWRPRRAGVPLSPYARPWRDAASGRIAIRGWTVPHYKDVPWLKAAYLAVFSLLGVYGYRYANGKAIARVRRQFMEPERLITPVFTAEVSSWQGPEGIIASEQIPGWIVKMSNRVVLLPTSWDTAFPDRMSGRRGEPIHAGEAPVWPLCRFGSDSSAGSFAFGDGTPALEVLGEDAFGQQGALTEDGERTSFLVVDCDGQEVTIMVRGTVGVEDAGRESPEPGTPV